MVAGRYSKAKSAQSNWRMKGLRMFFFLFAFVIIYRLFALQVVNASFYEALASGQHSFYQELFADRGSIFVKDWKDDVEYIAATNEPRAFVYADPRRIEDPEKTAQLLAKALGYEITSAEDEALEMLEMLEALDSEEIIETLEEIIVS